MLYVGLFKCVKKLPQKARKTEFTTTKQNYLRECDHF